jgi:hypothetical protein
MHKASKGLLAAFAVVLLLSLGAGTAAASRGLEASVATGELGRIRADSRALTFTDTEGAASIICEVLRTIRLNRTISKVRDSAAGSVTGVEIRNCRGGSVRVLGLPWSITYQSFTGTLPSEVRSVRLRIINAQFLISAFFGIAECLYAGNAEGTSGGALNTVSEIRADETVTQNLFSETLSSATCPARGLFRGTLVVSPAVRLRLI